MKIDTLKLKVAHLEQELAESRRRLAHQVSESTEYAELKNQLAAFAKANGSLKAGMEQLLAVNARLTEDAQNHFNLRRQAEKNYESCNVARKNAEDQVDRLDRALRDREARSDQRAMNAEAEVARLRAEIEKMRTEMVKKETLGRDPHKELTVVSKRFKHLEFE